MKVNQTNPIYLIYMYKEVNQTKSYIFYIYLKALNNQQFLICYESQPNQILYI